MFSSAKDHCDILSTELPDFSLPLLVPSASCVCRTFLLCVFGGCRNPSPPTTPVPFLNLSIITLTSLVARSHPFVHPSTSRTHCPILEPASAARIPTSLSPGVKPNFSSAVRRWMVCEVSRESKGSVDTRERIRAEYRDIDEVVELRVGEWDGEEYALEERENNERGGW